MGTFVLAVVGAFIAFLFLAAAFFISLICGCYTISNDIFLGVLGLGATLGAMAGLWLDIVFN